VIEPDRPDDSMLDPATEVDSPESEPFHFESEATHAFERSDEELRALVAEILPAVPVIARLVAREVGIRTDLADLCSVGNLALMEAARTFDPSRATFATYARRKLRWAMLDSVRAETYGRGIYSRARAVAGADRVAGVATAHPPDPSLPESSHARKLRTLIAAQAAALAVGLASPFAEESTSGDGQSGALVAFADPSPEDLVLRHRFSAELAAALQGLPERQRELVTRHYFKGERFDDIAASLGVSKSWASRLHAQAMETLAERLREHR
jgi:RNA polymerase sigma factor for flagellar operon FliA